MYLIAGLDETVRYSRTDADGVRLHPTIEDVTATLDGVAVTLSNDPVWDDTEQETAADGTVSGQEWQLTILGSEKPDAGLLAVTWSGTDEDGREFADVEECWVLANDAPDAGLVLRTAHFLRLDASDPVVPALVAAAVAYIAGAGVSVPAATDESATALYELAVCLYVNTIYSGGEDKLGPSMTAILLQMRA